MQYKATITFTSNENIDVIVNGNDLGDFLENIWKTGRYTSPETKKGFAVNPAMVKVVTYEEFVIPAPAPEVEYKEVTEEESKKIKKKKALKKK